MNRYQYKQAYQAMRVIRNRHARPTYRTQERELMVVVGNHTSIVDYGYFMDFASVMSQHGMLAVQSLDALPLHILEVYEDDATVYHGDTRAYERTYTSDTDDMGDYDTPNFYNIAHATEYSRF